MLKGLKKEFVVKRDVKKIILSSIIDALVISILFYIAITHYNEFLVKLLQAIAEKNIAYEVSWIMLPLIIIITIMINLGFFIANDEKTIEEAKKERKDKTKKENKKSKKQDAK